MKKKRSVAKSVYTLADLKKEIEVDPPIRLGIFGDPVEHSLSPQMQNAALRHCGIAMQYARFQVRQEQLADALSLAHQNNFVGLNLTIPHKTAALGEMDECDELA